MDDNVKKILELQEQGVPRKEIYKIMNYKKLDYLNRFMKRRGFILDGDIFVKSEEDNNLTQASAPDAQVETSKEDAQVENIKADEHNVDIIDKEEASVDAKDMINVIPEGFKENMINLVNQYDKLQEIINWFNTKDDDVDVIEINTGIRIELPEAPIKRTTIRVNEKVWNDFLDLADANSEFDKHSLLSMAIKEYVEKHKK